MRDVIALDTETWLIEPGLLAPPLVCIQWASPGSQPSMAHRDDPRARQVFENWLHGSSLLVGHNLAYDMAVLGAQWPDLLPAIFDKYDRDEMVDTMLKEQIVMIARGTFRSQQGADGEFHPVKYSLADCCARHFSRGLKKEGFRLFYRLFDEVPDISMWDAVASEAQAAWREGRRQPWIEEALASKNLKPEDVQGMLDALPSEARTYALADGTTTLELYESQEKHFSHLLKDQYRQARAAFALHLSSAWGFHTNPEAVETLALKLQAEFEALRFELQQAGIIREDGTADTKAAQQAMVQACAEEGLPVGRTKGGAVSLSAESCARFDEDSIVGKYSEFLTLRKTLANDIKMLRAGEFVPIQPRYDLADTGRSRASKPAAQAINRGAGIRECIQPREGMVFIQADFEGLELHTRAVWCLENIGWSKLAEDLNAGLDVHSVVGAEFLGMSYEDFRRALKGTDEALKLRCKNARQAAKAYNFGVPGGLGIAKTIRYAKTNYQVDMTEAEARARKDVWMRRQPEMIDFFASAARAVANPTGLGDEETLFSGRMGTNLRYSALCNRRFQALGADAAKEALWRVTRACYARPESPLFGCRPVLFVHDEIIAEAPAEKASAAAYELDRLMCEGANVYLSRVPVRTVPLIMTCWSKSAEPRYAEDGKTLLPWSPEWAAAEKARLKALAN